MRQNEGDFAFHRQTNKWTDRHKRMAHLIDSLRSRGGVLPKCGRMKGISHPPEIVGGNESRGELAELGEDWARFRKLPGKVI